MKNNKYKPLLSLAAIVLLAGCTKNFKDYNTNPNGLSQSQIEVDYQNLGEPLKQAQYNILVNTTWIYQLQQNLNADIYSGYMMTPSAYLGNSNNATYALVDGWNGYTWSQAYGNVMKPTQNILDITNSDQYKSFYSWAKILRVEAMHRVSDVYGPIIYTQYKAGTAVYDSQKDAYYAFFNDLDSAINVFTDLVQSGAPATFSKFDLVYGGDFEKWTKFANTLRLRLALRIAYADPDKAKEEGEKSLSNSVGLLTAAGDDDAYVNIGSITNPLTTITESWGDIRMGAPLLCYMNGYNDPRIKFYAQPATDPVVSGKFIGIRNGINNDGSGIYSNYSKLTDFPSKQLVMTAAEAWFLKAEAAIRGWENAGDAKTNYESGIATSFSQWGAGSATSYTADAASTEAPYVDPKSLVAGQNNVPVGSPYLSTITIKWDDAASFERKLERIITQKWIAEYPEGEEAWAEFRRTGYPVLFPVVVNNSGGTISTTAFIKRLQFSPDERSQNPTGVTDATQKLGGPDIGGTSLWWDTH